ncbi:MAG: hypothetical protein QXK67_07515 [Pyrobaculum sp.]
MIQLFTLLKQLLKGDLEIDVEKGSFAYKGVRIVALPVTAVVIALHEVAALFGEAAPILLERIGEGVGSAVMHSMGWRDGSDTIKELPNLAKAGGFGRVVFKDGVLQIDNLPLSLEDEALMAYMRGFMRGLCIELYDVERSGNSIKAKFKIIC